MTWGCNANAIPPAISDTTITKKKKKKNMCTTKNVYLVPKYNEYVEYV